MGRVVVHQYAMAYPCASVVAAPNDRTVFAKDILKGFDDQIADRPFVRLWR